MNGLMVVKISLDIMLMQNLISWDSFIYMFMFGVIAEAQRDKFAVESF